MAKEIEALKGDEIRLICPDCETMWSTLSVPSECDTCGATVTVRVLKKGDRPYQQQGSEK